MLLVQEYLENHSFQDLIANHGVYCSFDKTGSFFSLNYDQIEARESDPLSQQCRGLILCNEDYKSFLSEAKAINGRLSYNEVCPGKTKVLGCPFFRFFNFGQGACAEINWNDPNIKCYDKVDGTLSIVWHNPFTNRWNMATRSVPEADLLMDNGKYTFRTLFEKVMLERYSFSWEHFTKSLDKNKTYMFELCSVYNRIVVNYSRDDIVFLGARHKETLQEYDVHSEDFLWELPPFTRAKTYSLINIKDVVDFVSAQNPLEVEGCVVRDGQYNRIKVKNAAYVAFSKLRDTLSGSPRNMMELILLGKEDDALPALPPEIANDLIFLKNKVQLMIRHFDNAYQDIVNGLGVCSKKEFALALQKQTDLWYAPFFSIFDGKAANMKDFILKNQKDGSYPNAFLDKMLEMTNKTSNWIDI
jgi:RNA ligase